MKTYQRVAVLGAGVMGAQIAAHCANAGVSVVLYDLAGKQSPNQIVDGALAGLKKLEPSPLGVSAIAQMIQVANYDEDLATLKECDLIIEAIAEKMEWKKSLYEKIAPHINAGATIASNTSGLSINALAQCLPQALRSRFCGVHFFNPPRYMALVELIPAQETPPSLLDRLETWLTTTLGKSIVRAKDTPNFIANRIGVFAILAAMHHTARLGLGFDEVDAITGPLIGRPKSATYRTCDVVGLDTMSHVINTMKSGLPQDPWAKFYEQPAWLSGLIAQGALGQKTRAGIYRKSGKIIEVLDVAQKHYRESKAAPAPEVLMILKEKDAAKKMMALRASPHPQAQYLWSLFADIFHYSAFWLADIAHSARDIDSAMRWGFGWNEGPFEAWQNAHWMDVAKAISEDINAGKTMAAVALPDWVGTIAGVHQAEGSYSAATQSFLPRQTLPVYERQLYPLRLSGEKITAEAGKTIFENFGFRFWTHPSEPKVAIGSFTSKMHSMGEEVVMGLTEAIARAEKDFSALVIWHPAPFAVGANLKAVLDLVMAKKYDTLLQVTREFQKTMQRVKYAGVPVVSAVSGMALGGGCELSLASARRVLAFESYIGLVEAGVGLIPAGGGCKEMALRAAYLAERSSTKDIYTFIEPVFTNIAQGKVSRSALEARAMGFAQSADPIVLHQDELLFVALKQARAMAESGYQRPFPPPSRRKIPVCGRAGIANAEMMLVNMQEGGMISAHDYRVSRAIAVALCGGEIEGGSVVDEQWLLEVEAQEFNRLLQTDETAARIKYMLEKGKPLRN